jgi:hypothetical protein
MDVFFLLSGPLVTYLGRGDEHDSEYDDMLISRKLHETFTMDRYSGVPLNSDVCPFTLNIYPSDEYKSLYTTNNSIIFPYSVVLIFAFVTIVFIIYDANVERRQKLVLNTAEKSNAIVSSLFPSAIRDQMMQPDVTKKGPTKTTNLLHSSVEEPKNTMASLYPETTIFFADLAGFTAWSR